MSTPYATLYTRLTQANIPQDIAEIAGANIFILGEYGCNPIAETNDFIASYQDNPATALDALLMLVERVESRAVQA